MSFSFSIIKLQKPCGKVRIPYHNKHEKNFFTSHQLVYVFAMTNAIVGVANNSQ